MMPKSIDTDDNESKGQTIGKLQMHTMVSIQDEAQ